MILSDPVIYNESFESDESLIWIIALASLVILGIIFFIFRKKFKK
jgi:LPXTG-motif cell wall-anchored protein